MERIKEHLEKICNITEADWEAFSSRLIKCEFPRKSAILIAGQIENHISFIEEGIIRFYIPGKENDLTFGFNFEGEFTSGYDSFLTRTATQYTMETLTSTKLWRITYDDLQTIYQTTQAGNEMGRIFSERLFLLKSNRELSLLKETVEQRYLKIFKDRPNLIQKIPLKYISSYIGVTPQALSRIRRRIS